jgi:phosphoglycolate phosphatase
MLTTETSAKIHPYRLVIFDWDGTLMNSTADIAHAIQAACRDLELPVPDTLAASWVIGLSLERALYSVVPDLAESQRPLFIDRYRYHFLRRDPHIELFDGVQNLLDTLRDRSLTLAVATGKSRVGLDRTLASTGLKDYFAMTRCADETFGKPHPAMVNEIMHHLCIEPHEVVMVGDTSHDLDMAANAGVHGLGVSYGAHTIEHLKKSPHQDILHSIAEVKSWLLERV